MKKKIVLSIVILGLIGTASAQNIKVDGLEAENVNTSFSSDSIDFSTSYLNKSLTPKQVFFPDNISDKGVLTGFGVQDLPSGGKRLQYTSFQFDSTASYSDPDLKALLGNEDVSSSVNTSDAEDWTPASEGQVLYETGDIVLYDGNYYQADGATYNTAGTPTENTGFWTQVSGGATSPYPKNQFQVGAVSDIQNTENIGEVFDVDTTDNSATDYNVSMDIDVSSHYEHLILNYDLVYSNSTDTEIVKEWKDVYSGEKPDLLKVDYSTNRYNSESDGYVDEARMKYDNRYGEKQSVFVTVAYPKGEDFLGLDAPSGNVTKLSNNRYSQVQQTVNDLGINSQTLLDSTEGYELRTFEVGIQSDSINVIRYRVGSDFDSSGNDLRMWIEGSFGGGSGETQTVCSTEECRDLFNVTEGEWTDYPSYVQNMELKTVEDNVVNEMQTAERCVSRVNTTDGNTTCGEYETVYTNGDQKSNYNIVIDGLEYHGNGNIYINGSIEYTNFAYNNIFRIDSTNSSEYGFLSNNYLYEGNRITESNFFDLQNQLAVFQPTIVDGENGEVSYTSSSIGGGGESFAATIKLKDFRVGSISLNDDIGIRVETGAYNGGGSL